jgi:hypothetical protein
MDAAGAAQLELLLELQLDAAGREPSKDLRALFAPDDDDDDDDDDDASEATGLACIESVSVDSLSFSVLTCLRRKGHKKKLMDG